MQPTSDANITPRYQLIGKVGQGGMAAVHQALDLHLDRRVAIKVFEPPTATSPEATARFQREINAMVRHNHPNIVSLYDAGHTDDGRLFLVMELLDGCTLAQVLSDGPLRLADALDIAVQLARALDVVHGEDVVHRDLHPGNIFLVPGTQGWRLKLLDFGIARELGEAPLTLGDSVLGNPHYMSPEQALGGPVDCRADLYVLGAILYRALSGRDLFAGDNPLAVMLKHVHEPIPALDVAPEGLRRLLRELLEKDPELRPASAFEVAERLSLLWNRERSGALPSAFAAVDPRPAGSRWRRRLVGTVGAVGAVGLVAGLAGSLGMLTLAVASIFLVFGEGEGHHRSWTVPASEPICELAAACRDGRSVSCALAGRSYADGDGVRVDPDLARSWYETSCDQGWQAGCVLAHTAASTDPAVADADVRWLRKRCQHHDFASCLALTDPARAEPWGRGWPDIGVDDWLQQECARSNATACVATGVLWEEGHLIEADLTKAVLTYETLCDRGDRDACFRLASLHAGSAIADADAEHAASLNRRACDQGQRDACTAIARWYGSADGGERIQLADQASRDACLYGDLDACGRATY